MKHVYVVLMDGDMTVESSEINALRKAVATGGTMKQLEFGQLLSEAKAPGPKASKPRTRKPKEKAETAAPVADPTPEPEPETENPMYEPEPSGFESDDDGF